MTKEEIKKVLPMSELLARCGYAPNRAGFIRCPFHRGDNTPSMKVYKDSVYCFACGWAGDVFKVYQELNHCDFKTAFLALGGEYEKQDSRQKFKQKQSLRDAEILRQRREAEKLEAHRKVREATRDFWDWQTMLELMEALDGPDSDDFWDAVDGLGWAEIKMEIAEEVADKYDNQ